MYAPIYFLPAEVNRNNGLMLSQPWVPIMHLLHKVKKVKQHSDSMELERTEAGLSNINGEQQEDDDQYEEPG
jgi:hypothetical protein